MAIGSGEIERLDAKNYHRARSMLGRAFYNYNLMVHCIPDEKRRAAAVTTVYGALLFDCFRLGEVYVTPECTGAACWIGPGHGVAGIWRQIRCGMLAVPFRFGARGFWRLLAYDSVGQRLHQTHAPMPHWHLSVIGVEPALQGGGIGTALVEPMLARADSQGLPCYLDTHQESNVRLYRRLGFEIAAREQLPGRQIPVYAMLRKPRAGAS